MDLQKINFWKRLESFVSNVQINDPMSEEEKDMILNICKEEASAKEIKSVKAVGMGFNINQTQFESLKKWKASLPKIESATIGGAYTYEFTPTSIGLEIKVKRVDGKEIDLTEYEKW